MTTICQNSDVPPLALLQRRLIINLGKGGVGKSVVSAAMALKASQRHLRTLLVQLNARDYSSEYLGTRPITDTVEEVLPSLFCVNITPEAALKEYVLLTVKLAVIYKVVFQNRVVSAFLKAVPALSDLVMIGKIEYHVREEIEPGVPKYDVIIVDAPPTGHGMFFLSVPRVMAEAARKGPIKDHTERMYDLLRDHDRCAVNLISLPEDMPASEARHANDYLRTQLGITPTMLLINRCSAIEFTPEDEELVGALSFPHRKLRPEEIAVSAFRDDIVRSKRRIGHAERLIRDLDLPTVRVPELTSFRFSRNEIEDIADVLEGIL